MSAFCKFNQFSELADQDQPNVSSLTTSSKHSGKRTSPKPDDSPKLSLRQVDPTDLAYLRIIEDRQFIESDIWHGHFQDQFSLLSARRKDDKKSYKFQLSNAHEDLRVLTKLYSNAFVVDQQDGGRIASKLVFQPKITENQLKPYCDAETNTVVLFCCNCSGVAHCEEKNIVFVCSAEHRRNYMMHLHVRPGKPISDDVHTLMNVVTSVSTDLLRVRNYSYDYCPKMNDLLYVSGATATTSNEIVINSDPMLKILGEHRTSMFDTIVINESNPDERFYLLSSVMPLKFAISTVGQHIVAKQTYQCMSLLVDMVYKPHATIAEFVNVVDVVSDKDLYCTLLKTAKDMGFDRELNKIKMYRETLLLDDTWYRHFLDIVEAKKMGEKTVYTVDDVFEFILDHYSTILNSADFRTFMHGPGLEDLVQYRMDFMMMLATRASHKTKK